MGIKTILPSRCKTSYDIMPYFFRDAVPLSYYIDWFPDFSTKLPMIMKYVTRWLLRRDLLYTHTFHLNQSFLYLKFYICMYPPVTGQLYSVAVCNPE